AGKHPLINGAVVRSNSTLWPFTCLILCMSPELVLTAETKELFLSPRMRGLKLPVMVVHPSWGIGMAGELEDFTIGEVRLLLEGLVSMGTLVDVHIGNCAFAGEVLFCQRRGTGFETHVCINDLDESGL